MGTSLSLMRQVVLEFDQRNLVLAHERCDGSYHPSTVLAIGSIELPNCLVTTLHRLRKRDKLLALLNILFARVKRCYSGHTVHP
jgi:hypothetical protein